MNIGPGANMALPEGVVLRALAPNDDHRGTFVELFREEWGLPVGPVQWNAVRSRANVLRGVHAHVRHGDYLTVVDGELLVGLYDLRVDSATTGQSTMVTLRPGEGMVGLVIPPGVAHGFYAVTPTIHVYAVTRPWDAADELGCCWDDPGLGLDWPCDEPLLSDRDRQAGTLDELRAAWVAGHREAGQPA